MCDCIHLTNDALKERGLELATQIRFPRQGGGDLEVVLPISTQKINPKDRKVRNITLLGSFCPFCGEKRILHDG